MDGDFYYNLFDRTGPECRDFCSFRPFFAFLTAFNGAYLNTKRLIPAFSNQMVTHTAFIIFPKFNPANERCTFFRDDGFDQHGLGFFFLFHTLVVTAGGAADEKIPGFCDNIVFSFHVTLRAVSGDKH
jgi:hypothetical protein